VEEGVRDFDPQFDSKQTDPTEAAALLYTDLDIATYVQRSQENGARSVDGLVLLPHRHALGLVVGREAETGEFAQTALGVLRQKPEPSVDELWLEINQSVQ
jgi:hypothetical protein